MTCRQNEAKFRLSGIWNLTPDLCILAKQTHFQSSRSFQLRGSAYRLRRFHHFALFLLPFSFFTKRTHFSTNSEPRAKNFLQNEPIFRPFSLFLTLQECSLTLTPLYLDMKGMVK